MNTKNPQTNRPKIKYLTDLHFIGKENLQILAKMFSLPVTEVINEDDVFLSEDQLVALIRRMASRADFCDILERFSNEDAAHTQVTLSSKG